MHYSLKHKKQYMVICVCIGCILFVSFFFLFAIIGKASGETGTDSNIFSAFSVIIQSVIDKTTGAFSSLFSFGEGGMAEYALDKTKEYFSIIDSMNVNKYGYNVTAFVYKDNSVLYSIKFLVLVAAYAFLLIYMYVSLIRHASEKPITLEYFMNFFMRCAILLFILNNLEYLLTVIDDFLLAVLDGSMARYIDTFQNSFGPSFWGLRVNFFAAIYKVLIIISIIPICLEIFIRKILMPIAVVSIIEGGTRNTGFRYIKRYFAAYLRLLMIFLAYLITDLFTTLGDMSIVISVLVTFSSLRFSAKASSLVEEAIGI